MPTHPQMSENELAPNERIARHPNGHLFVERVPLPSEADFAAKFASLAKAWPVLAEHADHIDGEFDNALSDVKRMVSRLLAAVAWPKPLLPPGTTEFPDPPITAEEALRAYDEESRAHNKTIAALRSSESRVGELTAQIAHERREADERLRQVREGDAIRIRTLEAQNNAYITALADREALRPPAPIILASSSSEKAPPPTPAFLEMLQEDDREIAASSPSDAPAAGEPRCAKCGHFESQHITAPVLCADCASQGIDHAMHRFIPVASSTPTETGNG